MEWLTFSLSTLCAIGSFIGFVLAQREKKEAMNSEAAAKEYAENANKANLEIQRYTQHLNAEVDKQQAFDSEKEKVKRHIIDYYDKGKNQTYGVEAICQMLYQGNVDRPSLFRILQDLEADGLINERRVRTLSDRPFDRFLIIRDC